MVVVGAGAAGLLAAARAAERGRRTLLLEKNRKAGVKILMSGGTRCNLTHNTDAVGIIRAYGKPGKFLHAALAALGPADVVQLFEAEGVATKIESTGKIFPVSDRSVDVQQALLRRLGRSGCTLALGEPLLDLRKTASGAFQLTTPFRTIGAEKVIVTTGGKSYPGCGTTGEGYRWAAELGHQIVPPRPALVPMVTTASWIPNLKGLTIPDVGVRVVDATIASPKKAVLAQARGSFLFTHFGLSGPAVLDVSRAVAGHERLKDLAVVCDFLPNVSEEQLDQELAQAQRDAGKKQLVSVLPELLPRRLREALIDCAGLQSDQRIAELPKTARRRLIETVKANRVGVHGTLGFAKAEVTAGGVSLDEVRSKDMQSKIVENLYWAGEILDLDGPIGGFNFQAAFSTGWLAGSSV